MSKNGKGIRIALIVLCVVLALILALLVTATVLYETTLNRINRFEDETLSAEELEQIRNEIDETDPDFSGVYIDEDDITIPEGPVQSIGNGENIIHIMLVGQDRRPGESRQRTDAMILCSVNKSTKTITLTSFMRDTYLMIPGHYNSRMNNAYKLGGFEKLYETLEYNFGVDVDHGIEVDFGGFEKIVDLVGGVDIKLTASEARYMNKQGAFDADKSVLPGTWNLKEGVNHLSGAQALAYSRIRKLDSDFVRTNRQRTVLTAILEKCKDLSLTELYLLVDGMIPLISTDMDNAEITGYIVELFPLLSGLEVKTQRIPGDNDYYNATLSSGAQVLMPDLEGCRQMLKDTIGE